MRSSVSSRPSDVVSALFVDASECDRGTIMPHLRARTPMTIGHEVAHAIDCALGDGVYRSG